MTRETAVERGKDDARDAATRSPSRRVLAGCLTAAGIAVITLTIFFIIEGFASTALFIRHALQHQEGVLITERQHTHYDPELGWVSTPNLSLPNQYGPGKLLTTNERGFRGAAPVHRQIPQGMRRVLCSGDSFTLGHGVADDKTWCAQLARMRPELETVNMGQGGYGIDQAYLWYRRDGADLDRSVHVMAFIGDDFFRMQRDHFLGYGKPILRLTDGTLITENVPVPQRGVVSRWLTQNAELFQELSTVKVLGGLVRRAAQAAETGATVPSDTLKVARTLFDTLEKENRARGSRLVLLFLPTPWDYNTELYAMWRDAMHRYSEESGVPLVDMVAELRALPEASAQALFIPQGEIGAPHLNEEGNVWVARHLIDSGVLDQF